ncbi:MAG: riboflavin kinase, partial [Porcipelethomonas sp.]
VFTFDVESIGTKHGRSYEYIYSESQKHEILDEMGIRYIYAPGAGELQDMSGEEFARKILCGVFNAGAVVCGENFRFGKGASCGADELAAFGEKYGFEVRVINLLKMGGTVVSSEGVRSMLREGRVSELSASWGITYFVDSVVSEGNKIGRTLDFPTINQHFEARRVVPRKGVYRSRAYVDGKVYDAVTNVGTKPTVEKKATPLAETHILDFCGDLYGRRIKVELLDFIRDEMKFSSLEELKKQVFADIDAVRKTRADQK